MASLRNVERSYVQTLDIAKVCHAKEFMPACSTLTQPVPAPAASMYTALHVSHLANLMSIAHTGRISAERQISAITTRSCQAAQSMS